MSIYKANLKQYMGTPLAVVVLVCSLSISLFIYELVERNTQKEAQIRFDYYKQLFITKMQNQLGDYSGVLRGAAGLFYTSDAVSRSDWKHYIDTLNIQGNFPGIQGIGYSQLINHQIKKEHEMDVQKQGFSDYQIYPNGDRAVYSPIIYIEPFDWRNQRAFGFDMYSDKSMKEAMERARDTGDVAITDKVVLMQETSQDTQVGFIMYVPVYTTPHESLSVDERRSRIKGYVYSPFRMKDLMHVISESLGKFIDVKVYDGSEVSPFTLMYNSNAKSNDNPVMEQKIQMMIGGRPWTVLVDVGDDFNESVYHLSRSALVLICGIIISFLLFIITWSLSTSRERALKLAEKMTKDLRVSEERYALSVAGSSDGLWDWDIVNDDLHLSARFKTLLSYNENEFTSSRQAIEKIIHPEDFDEIYYKLQAHLNEHKPFDVECRLRLKNGDYSWFRVKGQAIWDQSDKPLRMAGSLSDINDKKLAAIFLQKQKHELELANKYKSEFLANMSHELRTPLNSILVLSHLLAVDTAKHLTDSEREKASVIYKSGTELLDLITDILDLSKIEAGKMDIYVDKLNIKDFSSEIYALFKNSAEEQGLGFEVIIGESVPDVISTDHKRLYQVLKNLVSNALKFTHSGKVVVSFFKPLSTVSLNDELDPSNTLGISVTDSGIGIPIDKFEMIFQAFRQADGTTSRKYGGTGLGLTISKEIITLLGGLITVESTVDKGSIFTVYIPIHGNQSTSSQAKYEDQQPNQENLSPSKVQLSENPLGIGLIHARLLLVDDDVRNIYALTSLLESYGCEVVTAENGVEAVEIVKNDLNFNVILMDMMMPVMDGYKAMICLKKMPDFNIPIIAITAKAMPGDREKCLKYGADDYLCKPIIVEHLLQKIQRYLSYRTNDDVKDI